MKIQDTRIFDVGFFIVLHVLNISHKAILPTKKDMQLYKT